MLRGKKIYEAISIVSRLISAHTQHYLKVKEKDIKK